VDIDPHNPNANRRGRPPGVPNKVTTRIRDAFALLVSENLDNLSIWLAAVAEKDPLAALRVITDLAEFSIPKLARSEISHEGVAAIPGEVMVVIHSKDPPKDPGAVQHPEVG